MKQAFSMESKIRWWPIGSALDSANCADGSTRGFAMERCLLVQSNHLRTNLKGRTRESGINRDGVRFVGRKSAPLSGLNNGSGRTPQIDYCPSSVGVVDFTQSSIGSENSPEIQLERVEFSRESANIRWLSQTLIRLTR